MGLELMFKGPRFTRLVLWDVSRMFLPLNMYMKLEAFNTLRP